MKVRFLGTGAAEGIPAIFCRCELCQLAKKKGGREARSRFQVLINDDLLVDFPPDSYMHMLGDKLDFSKIENLLITHSHSDHFYPEDLFMRGLYSSYNMQTPVLTVHGSGETVRRLIACDAAFPKGSTSAIPIAQFEGYDVMGRCVEYHELNPYDKFRIAGYEVGVVPSVHMEYEPSFVYFICDGKRSVLVLSDTAVLKENAVKFIAENVQASDLIVYDCTYGFKEAQEGHMNIFGNVVLKERLREVGVSNGKTLHVITHIAHNQGKTHAQLQKDAGRMGFTVAYDGLELDL